MKIPYYVVVYNNMTERLVYKELLGHCVAMKLKGIHHSFDDDGLGCYLMHEDDAVKFFPHLQEQFPIHSFDYFFEPME